MLRVERCSTPASCSARSTGREISDLCPTLTHRLRGHRDARCAPTPSSLVIVGTIPKPGDELVEQLRLVLLAAVDGDAESAHGCIRGSYVVLAGVLRDMSPVKRSRCCQGVCGFRYAGDMGKVVTIGDTRVLIVEDEPYLADAIRDGLRLEAIAADIAGDGDTALELLRVNAYDIAVLDRDIPGPSGDEVAERIVASGTGMPILMLTAADRLDDKASGFHLGADDYLTKPFELQELVLRLRALDRRRAHHRPPVREIAGLRLDPFRREVYRDGRYVALTRKQFAVLEVLVGAEGGVVSTEELLERAWDEHADPFTNAVRITVSALRKRLGEPWVIATVAGVGYRIDTQPGARP